MTEPHELTLTEAVAAIRQRRLSPVELTRALLERIDRLEPRLQAWAELVPEQALQAAGEAQQALAQGRASGALFGVPFAAKDVFDTAGVRTAAGFPLWADRIPDKDSAPVAIAKGAGGILLGKLHTTQFADGDPAPSRNPWDPEHTAGGSSTGSGVAVAARMVPWAFGSQTVGSVLRPAAYNGVVGFKPTFGRISRLGVVPMATSFDHVGVLTRSVEDAALLLSALAGHDPDDPYSADAPVDDYLSGLKSASAPRIGLVRRWFFEEADAESRLLMEAVAQRLVKAGALVEEIDPGIDFGRAFAEHRLMQESEMAVWHEPLYSAHRAQYGPKIAVYLENGFTHTAMEYVRALEYRRTVQRLAEAALAKFDVLLMPTASGPAPRDLTQTGDTRFQSPWSYTGFPSLSVPAGLATNGLPLGVQMAAPPFREARLLTAAHWIEQALGVDLRPPLEQWKAKP